MARPRKLEASFAGTEYQALICFPAVSSRDDTRSLRPAPGLIDLHGVEIFILARRIQADNSFLKTSPRFRTFSYWPSDDWFELLIKESGVPHTLSHIRQSGYRHLNPHGVGNKRKLLEERPCPTLAGDACMAGKQLERWVATIPLFGVSPR